ncbi:MAG: serine hydrolase domain-containing protein [Acidimicrobiia bacterium]
MEDVARLLTGAVDAGTVPGAVALVRLQGEVIWHDAFGLAAATLEPPRPMTPETIFDLASVTKPLVGATLTLALVDRGILSLDQEITTVLPELAKAQRKGVTFRRILSHTSGLPGWRPLYVWARDRNEILGVIDRLGLATDPGTRFEYSDLGFVILGLALERITGRGLEESASDLVFGPLGMSRTGYLPPSTKEGFAVTEEGNAFEKGMADWAGMEFSGWRTDFYPGEVNDGNTHYALGGVSAHAGAFSNASDLGLYGEMWIGALAGRDSRVLSKGIARLATSEQAPHGARRGLGWDLMKTGGPTLAELSRADAGFFPPAETPWLPRSSGELLSPSSFGHTGFTGTSMWIDPERELVAILLTNATHPRVDLGKPVNSLRARFHNAVVAAIDSQP